jgi:hypothetical protein
VLVSIRELRLLDLRKLLCEEGVTEFHGVDWRGMALTRIRLRATSHATGFARTA